MEFPDAAAVDPLLDDVAFPHFAVARQRPPTPTVDDAAAAARDAVGALPLDRVPAGGTVAVGLGSRGITDVVPVARAVVDGLAARGFDPVVVPAMGSHGGATPEGQREALAALGLTPEALGCPVDARTSTDVVGSAGGLPVHVATAAREADGVLVVNRVKPHTNFTGRVESGLCKMATVGLGKQPGARTVHRRAFRDGYVTAITEALQVVADATPFLGGVAIVENAADETASVTGLRATDLPDAEADLLDRARAHLPTLPVDDLDVLVVERIGKDVSGTGMDPNVTGRYGLLGGPSGDGLADRIAVLGLTETTHGNASGIGVADVTTVDALGSVDLATTYANVLTSGSLRRSRLPVALPDEASALTAALTTAGPYDPETARVAWIRDTSHLTSFRVSRGLVDEVAASPHVTVGDPSPVAVSDGVLEPPDLPE
ncbi:MAG: DUF362 domain-containing protein [Halobacteriaceae archaeon]